ncbi:MAG: nucleotidyltransferase [Clostridiales bacterium]|nr:nucleotidyltransferase [Clostridiales bacterium]
MKTVGIIAEYNPFHNGHAYQIARAKEITGADYCIVVMSGDFVQRGAPALMDKYLRTECALRNGADLVLELPVYYALGSAEYFASGAVALLDKLGVTDALCFGSECGDIALLSEFAARLLEETPVFQSVLHTQLRSGLSYPNARNAALLASAPHLSPHIGILSCANNILGIEYCKALLKRGSTVRPCTVRRAGASYHDACLDSGYSSALAIRSALTSSNSLASVQGQLPPSAYALMQSHYGMDYPILSDDLSELLHYQLLSEQPEGYTCHPDIDQELSNRIRKLLPRYQSFSSFCGLLHTKNRTYTRISRSMAHILLHLRRDRLDAYRREDFVLYARMLGFRQEAQELLAAVKERSQIPLISKLADADALLTPLGVEMLSTDIFAGHIYQAAVQHKYQAPCLAEQNEYNRQLIRV